ncbi:hypothetical protein QJS10_CPB15g01952 [Acorus calamus]|uniref:RING-type domain-containing protein n=1 Tax=Acorus calamus TaxID=4465 RepID=A0AAV9D893_ACOCL|nr:hypothetical protein QJS10_CPB15g01952 [Acorus calamus]
MAHGKRFLESPTTRTATTPTTTGQERSTDLEEGGGGGVLEECVICKEDMEPERRRTAQSFRVRLMCGHDSFDVRCIFSWLSVPKRTCPVCRALIRAVTYV